MVGAGGTREALGNWERGCGSDHFWSAGFPNKSRGPVETRPISLLPLSGCLVTNRRGVTNDRLISYLPAGPCICGGRFRKRQETSEQL